MYLPPRTGWVSMYPARQVSTVITADCSPIPLAGITMSFRVPSYPPAQHHVNPTTRICRYSLRQSNPPRPLSSHHRYPWQRAGDSMSACLQTFLVYVMYMPQIFPKSRHLSGAKCHIPFPFPTHHHYPRWPTTDCASALPWALWSHVHVLQRAHGHVSICGLLLVGHRGRGKWGGWVLCGAVLGCVFLQEGA